MAIDPLAELERAVEEIRAAHADVLTELDRRQREHFAQMQAAQDALVKRTEAIQREVELTVNARLEGSIAAATRELATSLSAASADAERSAENMDRIARRQWINEARIVATWCFVALFAAYAVGAAHWLLKEPKIRDRWLLCTAAWVERTQECRGKIYEVPEDYEASNRTGASK